MNATRKYSVAIAGQKYSLISDDSEEIVTQATDLVNAILHEITQKLPAGDTHKAAVLTSLKLARDFIAMQHALNAHTDYHQRIIGILDSALNVFSH